MNSSHKFDSDILVEVSSSHRRCPLPRLKIITNEIDLRAISRSVYMTKHIAA
jgi:hypothetical protein